MHVSEEDYIKVIYELTVEKNEELVKTHELALRFNFTDQTVNEMVKKLSAKNLLVFSPYKGVSLTEEGKKEAVRMIRAHRIWEVFLTKSLGLDWTEVHSFAEDLEHASSERLIEKLYDFLNHPAVSHDGAPIPDLNGMTSNLSQTTLYDLNAKDKFKIVRVIDVKGMLQYLDNANIKIYDEFEVASKNDFIETIEIVKDGVVTTLTKKIANLIYIEKL